MNTRWRHGPWRSAVALFAALLLAGVGPIREVRAAAMPVVEVEEELYRYEPADNGAGPMWCHGSTCLVRVGEVVYATGLETLAGAKPLNNCRWVLWRRDRTGWQRWVVDETGRTREPAPLVTLGGGRLALSANPTLNPPEREGGGPARPEIRVFRTGLDARETESERLYPRWQGQPRFTEHSYRSFAADGSTGAMVLFQNIDYTHAEWAFRDGAGAWSAQGQLKWPWGATYAKPQPIRVCYPNVALRGEAVHFVGVSDIQEPNPEWRAYKRELTGKEWDYDFRRLFYTWTPDLAREPFRDWVEIASRERTGGGVSPGDLHLAEDGSVHVVWTERALDERLRAKFFPNEKQSHSLRYARLREGRVVTSRVWMESSEEQPGPMVGAARFHATPDGRLWLVSAVSEGGRLRNEVAEVLPEGRLGPAVMLGFEKPFGSYFTATPRAGSAPSDFLDLLGVRSGTGNAIGYARVRFSR